MIANIANGSSAKEFVMRDESLLKRLMQYMMNDSVKLQMAATYCVSNLVWSTEDGAVGRQQKLRDLGVQKLLQSLLTTSDVNLFERYVLRSLERPCFTGFTFSRLEQTMKCCTIVYDTIRYYTVLC